VLVVRIPVEIKKTKTKVSMNVSSLGLSAKGADIGECLSELETLICDKANVQMVDFLWYDDKYDDELKPYQPAVFSDQWDVFMDLIHEKEHIFGEHASDRKKRVESQNHLKVGK
jgi:hypothetical protein